MHKLYDVAGVLKISGAPPSKLTARDAQQCAAALFGQGHPAGFNNALSVSNQPASSPSSTFTTAAPQTTTSTPETSSWSLCTPTGMLSQEDKQTLTIQADYCVVKIDGLNVYASLGTPQSNLVRHTRCLRGNNSFLFLLVPIPLPLPTQVPLSFLLKCFPTISS